MQCDMYMYKYDTTTSVTVTNTTSTIMYDSRKFVIKDNLYKMITYDGQIDPGPSQYVRNSSQPNTFCINNLFPKPV